MRILRLAVAAALFGWLVPAAAAAQPQTPGQAAQRQDPIVDELVLVGAGDRDAEIRMAMRTRVNERLNADQQARDTEFLWSRMRIRLDRWDIETISESRVKVTIYVSLLDAQKRILFEGNEEFERGQLLIEAGLNSAQAIDRGSVQRIIRDIKAFYAREGFRFAEIEPVFEEDRDQVRLIINEGPLVRVGDVEFIGNEAFNDSAFLGIGIGLSDEIEAGDGFLFFPGSEYSEELARRDLIAIEQLYHDFGYLDAKASIHSQEFYSDNSRVALTYEVVEGPLYTVREVRIESADETVELRYPPERLMEMVGLKPGQALERARIAADEAALREFYGRRGHPAAAAALQQNTESFWHFNPPNGQPEMAYDLGTREVTITYRIREGRPMRIRDIVIRGNKKTQDRVIRRQISLEPGDLADSEEAVRSYRRLLGLNYFADPETRNPFVDWRFMETDRQDWVDMQFSVMEGQTGNLLFGGGINTNTGPFISLNINKENFDLFDLPSSVTGAPGEILDGKAFTGAGQGLRFYIAPGTELSTFTISFLEPDLFGDHIDRFSMNTQLFKTFFLLDTHDEERTGASLALGRNFGRHFSVFVRPEIQEVVIDDINSGAPFILLETAGASRMQAVALGANYNTVDDPFAPIDGETFGMLYQQAGEWAGGDWDFNKIEVSGAKYFPLWQDSLDRYFVLALSGAFRRAKETGSLSGVPYSERYFIGGQGTIRGFDFRGVGPRNIAGFPLGGEAAWYGSAEVRFPLISTRVRGSVAETEYIRGAFFIDAGSAGRSVSAIGPTRLSVGVGARIRIPFMPQAAISLDFGFPISSEPFDDERVFSFNFGNF